MMTMMMKMVMMTTMMMMSNTVPNFFQLFKSDDQQTSFWGETFVYSDSHLKAAKPTYSVFYCLDIQQKGPKYSV